MMSSPLSTASDAMLNSTSSTSGSEKYEDAYDGTASTPKTETSSSSRPESRIRNDDARSSQESVSPVKSRHSRIMSGTELSPLRIVESQRSSLDGALLKASGGVRSPRKVSPDRRFPVKINIGGNTITRVANEQSPSIDEVVSDSDGLRRPVSIFDDRRRRGIQEEDEEGDHSQAGDSTIGMEDVETHHRGDATAGDEDFMDVSAFSSFSAVPNMAMLAKLGRTPTAKRGAHAMDDEDFNERLGRPHRSSISSRRDILSPSRTTPNLPATATPSRQLSSLIDLDTPRNVPSITARELESLKSNFLSEISSLKASLSGKEAEVHSLKTAVVDAEKRVGETMEKMREERSLKEEMENVLRIVREEIIETQREKDELEQQLDESEKRREMSEMMHQEAESKLAGMRAGRDMEKNASPEKPSSNTREVEIAVERVARELHALYKSKHETKVAALKKSYESRWEKKVRELEAKIQGLTEENEKLQSGGDVTLTKFGAVEMEELKQQSVRDHATIRELEADVQRLEAVVSTVRSDNDDLRINLQQERVEKGELVQLAEELMAMQTAQQAPTPAPPRQPSPPQAAPQREMRSPPPREIRSPPPREIRSPPPQMRQPTIGRADSVSSKAPKANPANRLSGLRAPGTMLRQPHERGKGSVGGLPRPNGARNSGILSNIEKMGYRGQ
ncbi:hypothetical protein LI328DRAFT_124103 [Trichoderma asperelloides]|nr:hypothetical protein LI328DRAFT_124103 [Trichoderma asperelloides]